MKQTKKHNKPQFHLSREQVRALMNAKKSK